MATAPRKSELTPHAQFQAEHAARVASINNTKAAELAELEAATTRAHVLHEKALKVAAAEHAARRLERNAAVIGETIPHLRNAWRSFVVDHSISRAQVLGNVFRDHDAVHERDLGRPIGNEFGVAVCEEFHAAHPTPDVRARLANVADNWNRLSGDGIATAVQRANAALRNQFYPQAMQAALLQLEATIARVATAPGYFGVGDAEALWDIHAACLPPDEQERRLQAHNAAVKARNIEAHVAETALRMAAVRGDREAREALNSRGPGVLDALLRNAASILRMAGLSDAEAERQAAS